MAMSHVTEHGAVYVRLCIYIGRGLCGSGYIRSY